MTIAPGGKAGRPIVAQGDARSHGARCTAPASRTRRPHLGGGRDGPARGPDGGGASTPRRDGREQIGWLLRSKPRCNPLVVSPGHRVAMASAPELVMRYTTTYRLPEPTRLADRLASRRDR
jgi:hypothetical protein